MNTIGHATGEQVKAFCARIGKDPLLVQGAGGNVSWKDGNILWVKASGTWLAQAETHNIFIPVDYAHLQQELTNKNFSVKPRVLSNSKLRPSIETLLHALMPHKVVVHLHAIEILAHLVRENPIEDIKKLVSGTFKWVFVEYFKPGEDLAQSIASQLVRQPDTDVVFLKNHGVVIGGGNIESINQKLDKLLLLLGNKVSQYSMDCDHVTVNSEFLVSGYVPCSDHEVNKLATKNELASRLKSEWVLYPDHVVFLGEKAFVVEKISDLNDSVGSLIQPIFIFVLGQGVLESKMVTDAQKAQLRCYYDVLIRQSQSKNLHSLTGDNIAELLDWDAEKYRQKCL